MLGRYLLFAGEIYDQRGGWDDFVTDSNDVDDLAAHTRATRPDWWHIIDTDAALRMDSHISGGWGPA